MSKRSDFPRIAKDAYQTIDPRAVAALVPHLDGVRTFAEPCVGKWHLVHQLEAAGLLCGWASDIDSAEPTDARTICAEDIYRVDAIITNPPWSRPLLHELILHFQSLAPTWLLFDAGWHHTRQSIPYMKYCTDIVSIGRLIWIPGTNMTGKDDCCWYRFHANEENNGTRFHGRRQDIQRLSKGSLREVRESLV